MPGKRQVFYSKGVSIMVDLYPKRCNICGGDVSFVRNSLIYGKRYGSGYAYLCERCGAYVGTHKDAPTKAMGILSNIEMRKWKVRCHEIFDSLWRGKSRAQRKREALYAWLAKKMNIPVEECHFGYFDLEQLKRAHRILLSVWGAPIQYDSFGNVINEVVE